MVCRGQSFLLSLECFYVKFSHHINVNKSLCRSSCELIICSSGIKAIKGEGSISFSSVTEEVRRPFDPQTSNELYLNWNILSDSIGCLYNAKCSIDLL